MTSDDDRQAHRTPSPVDHGCPLPLVLTVDAGAMVRCDSCGTRWLLAAPLGGWLEVPDSCPP